MNNELKQKRVGSVLIVGGGITGIQASLDLADSGFKVYLLDKSPSVGGAMAQLDKTFPTNDCAMCIMSPKLVTCGRHLNIEVITDAEIKGIKGNPGNFEVEIIRKTRYIDIERCTGCGACVEECPINVIDAYNEGLSLRKAIYIKYPQAVPLAYSIDKDKCIGCGRCKNICLSDAIKYENSDKSEALNVGAVLLALGFDEFDANLKPEYGYGRFKNVITSIEFERILSASGPYEGHVFRPSDSRIPEKIAFIQCVGSRDENTNKYCSSVCCMYATKEAVIAKEHADQEVEPTIFFMDIRAYGKDFDKYITRAKEEYGVRFVRSRVSNVEEVPETKNLRIKYEDEEGKLVEEEFDLVVLSVGLSPPKNVKELASTVGIELNEYGFCQTDEFEPLKTSRDGIYVCGAFQGPKDIPESVMQASGATAEASSLLSTSRGTLVEKKGYPPEIDVTGEEPRIGVFVCHCGVNIGAYIDVPKVVEYAKELPNVAYAERNLYTCSQDTQQKIKEKIKEHKLNRVIVASCTPRTHEPLFQETIREAGLNPYLFEMANIRDQCSWVHMHEPEGATKKAEDLVRMAVAKARLLKPLPKIEVEIIPKALIIGGGLAGMMAALEVAKQGFEVYLVEKEKELGGNLRKIYYTLYGQDAQAFLSAVIAQVEKSDLIHVYREAEIKNVEGSVGKFKTTIGSNGVKTELEHGIIIVATGAQEYKPKEYLYGKDKRVITQREFEERIANHPTEVKNYENIVMIQCVGSRDGERPYCSRVCCSEAIKNALKMREIHEKSNIFILYRDVRTYGFKEEYYKKAREAGIMFVRYEDDKKPIINNEGGNLTVSVFDLVLKESLLIEPDILVLSVAMTPNDDNKKLAEMLKVPLNEDNFFLEAHVKLRPVEFATDGIFLCGLAHSPKFIDESIAQAYASASKACAILSKDHIESDAAIVRIVDSLCSGCGACVEVCPAGALSLNEQIGKSEVNPILCKGCGLCSAACRAGAIQQNRFEDVEVLAMIDAALGEEK